MAFIVHIQTICPVYRPKAHGSWKCWTHHMCSRANLGTCRKCIWIFYSAWTISEILNSGNEELNLKYCRGRKCMLSVYNSSKHSFSLAMKDFAVLSSLLCAEHWLKYPTEGNKNLSTLQNGSEPFNQTISTMNLGLKSQKCWMGVVINWLCEKTWQLQGRTLRFQEYNLVSSQPYSLPSKTIGVTASHFSGLMSA